MFKINGRLLSVLTSTHTCMLSYVTCYIHCGYKVQHFFLLTSLTSLIAVYILYHVS